VTDDACAIFQEKGGWYRSARRASSRWGVPIPVQLAIIHQESHFRHDAKPPRRRLFWIIPWFRPSSAYGYGQATDETWERYKSETSKWWADRDDFADVADFVGWYGHLSHQELGIAKGDAFHQYLAYHEGHGGYKRKTYRRKPWLLQVARRVEANAQRYQNQLAKCQGWPVRRWRWLPF
jgi:hypothetical protein